MTQLGLRVLVVDDDQGVNRAVRRMLTSYGCSVQCAYDGGQALDDLGESHFDLILSDVDMPIMSGIRLHEVVCEKHPTLKDRFIFMTANYGILPSLKAPFLLKPCGTESLLAMLQKMAGVSGETHV